MCGIAGLYAYHDAANPVDMTELRGIRDHMAARGPDGRGEWLAPDGRVGLGNRRLAIIDLSDGGAQPMASANRVITFNGEIYNYRSLRSGLEAKGYVFRTRSDTEVLLHLYAAKGEGWWPIFAACLHSPYGMQTPVPCLLLVIPMASNRSTTPTTAGHSVLLRKFGP